MDWHAEESTAAVQPMTMLALDVDFDSSAMGGISGSVVRGVVSGVVDSMSDQGFVEVSTGNGVMRLLSENHHRKHPEFMRATCTCTCQIMANPGACEAVQASVGGLNIFSFSHFLSFHFRISAH